MKQILVISGKGGTGKTILTASFAALAEHKIMVDCDVDAADLHLILHPVIRQRREFRSGTTARIDQQRCTACGACARACRFAAIDQNHVVNPVACEGCGLCSRLCPAQAITMEENLSGEWYISDTAYGPLVHAALGIAEENSGKLVAKVRQAAKEIAEQRHAAYIIIDGPPGIGCPVIASLSGVDTAVIVTEPTLSGVHDMQRVIAVAEHFKVSCTAVINKFDLHADNTRAIETYCHGKGIPVAGKIPFSRQVCQSIVNGVPAVTYCTAEVADEITRIWQAVRA